MIRFARWMVRSALLVTCITTWVTVPAQTFKTVLDFQATTTGGSTAALVQGVDGNLYGVGSGGKYNQGTIFRISRDNKLTVVYNFCEQYPSCPDGADPVALMLSSDGNFYGATSQGGNSTCQSSCGTLFKLNPTGKFTTFYQFNGEDGSNPIGGLAEAPDGSLYGTTVAGGAYGGGTVFRITRESKLTTIYSFCEQQDCTDGYQPTSTLTLYHDGAFYGITSFGGTGASCDGLFNYGCGTAYRISPSGSHITLYSFCSVGEGCSDGYAPYSGLLLATDGNFYGVTQTTTFRLMPDGALATLYTFCSKPNCSDGSWAQGELIEGTDKNLYGGTAAGGNSICQSDFGTGCGTIFDITSADAFTTLHRFDQADGETPLGGLVQATNGSFYGTTLAGGSHDSGTMFSLNLGLDPFVAFVRNYGRSGQTAQIIGQGFEGTTNVLFNGVPANFTVRADTLLTAVVPAGTTTGNVTVTTPTGVLTSNVPFQVIP